MSTIRTAIQIPLDKLSADAIEGVVEEFVTRDGTDYGEVECSLEVKRQRVITQLLNGEVTLVFDPESSTCNLVPRQDLPTTPAQG